MVKKQYDLSGLEFAVKMEFAYDMANKISRAMADYEEQAVIDLLAKVDRQALLKLRDRINSALGSQLVDK